MIDWVCIGVYTIGWPIAARLTYVSIYRETENKAQEKEWSKGKLAREHKEDIPLAVFYASLWPVFILLLALHFSMVKPMKKAFAYLFRPPVMPPKHDPVAKAEEAIQKGNQLCGTPLKEYDRVREEIEKNKLRKGKALL